jgi:hypothetical protein
MQLRPLFANGLEAQTDKALHEVARRNGLRVCPKVGVAEVLQIHGSGISDAAYTYALKANFDFVVCDAETTWPLFAVEFDGPRHRTDPATIARDRVKDDLCRRFRLSLLRIDAQFLRRLRELTVLGWLVELWALHGDWLRAQSEGRIPWSEPFCYEWVGTPKQDGTLGFAYDLSEGARSAIVGAYQRGILVKPSSEVVTGIDQDGYAVGYGLLELTSGGYIIAKARCRSFRFSPVTPAELVEELATVNAHEALEQFERGEYRPRTVSELAKLRRDTRGWTRQGGLLDDLPYAPSGDPG